MKISGFTIVRNAVKLGYPALESIRSILPICDEFIVNIGDSDDDTEDLIRSLQDNKVRCIRHTWDFGMGKEVLSHQTNLALAECRGDWAFYLQSDEVIHERDLPRLRRVMRRHWHNPAVEALRFRWLHFYGSYYRYRIDAGWYQKQDRIIRNTGKIRSCGDAYAFEHVDGRPLQRANTGCLLYHYGWVHTGAVMSQRRRNAQQIGYAGTQVSDTETRYDYGDLTRFPVYFGTHPRVMHARVADHALSREDFRSINRRYWWHPLKVARARYKTGRRVKDKIN